MQDNNNIIQAIKDLKKGRPIIIVDDTNRENEGDLVASAQFINPYTVNFMVKHSSGIICVATTQQQLDKLKLYNVESTLHKKDPLATPFTLSCEASHNITTGVSAFDRAYSIKIIGDPNSKPSDIVVPGHLFPLKAHPLGLKARKGHTEASVELCKLANLWPAAAIVELPDENGHMLKGKALETFAKTYDLTLISIKNIDEVKLYSTNNSISVSKVAEANLPTEFGKFNMGIWKDIEDNEHISLTMGDIKGTEKVPVRIHSQCLTGDVFHSLKCDCGEQLIAALKYISQKGVGILIWLRQEGRGIGLTNKIKAYHLQDTLNLDTVEANLALDLPVDSRSFKEAIDIINYYKPKSIELLTNNPQKLSEVEQYFNKNVTRKKLIAPEHKENKNYLKIKQTKLAHLLNIKD